MRCILVGSLILLAALAQPAAVQTRPAGSHDDAEVRRVWAELDRQWNARDAVSFTALFTREASFVFVDRGEVLEGHDQILERFSVQFPAMAPDLRHRATITEIRSISADARVVDGTVQILRGADVVLHFVIFGVMVREAEGWRIGILRVVELPAELMG